MSGSGLYRLVSADTRSVKLLVRAQMVARHWMPEMMRATLRRIVPTVVVRVAGGRAPRNGKTPDDEHQGQEPYQAVNSTPRFALQRTG